VCWPPLYLEEFAPRARWTEWIEVSINNLAAVPSIIFGLLGLAVLHLPARDAALGAADRRLDAGADDDAGDRHFRPQRDQGRAALDPRRALAMGASPVQTVFHHVLPLALPGILTGTIIGMARALGETAPLLMIGMRAFVVTPPDGITDPGQRAADADIPVVRRDRPAFVQNAPRAIIVLLVFLLVMNGLAIYLRNKFEKSAGEGHDRNSPPRCTARNVDVFYGEKQAIDNVSIDIDDGIVTAFIGPSGCGKSTFLRSLNRMNDTIADARVTGEIRLDGEDVYAASMDPVPARAGGHGVPEAQPVPQVDLREHRLRSAHPWPRPEQD
jgi:hypothetical protein